jgi:hypothetical protein
MAPNAENPSPLAECALRRQALEVGAVCGNPASTDLHGGGWQQPSLPRLFSPGHFETFAGHRIKYRECQRNPKADMAAVVD